MTRDQIVSSIIISIIAALSGYLASRASAKASVKNVATSSRVEMEKEAYERARKMDTQTIERQDAELAELFENQRNLNADIKLVNKENELLHGENRIILEDNARLRTEVAYLRQRVVRLERGLHPDATERLYERKTDTNPMLPESTPTDPMMREILENGREYD
jgi:predicted nuclease with TOPRIM domain